MTVIIYCKFTIQVSCKHSHRTNSHFKAANCHLGQIKIVSDQDK